MTVMRIGGEPVAERIERLIAVCADTLQASAPASVRAVFLYGSSLDRLFRPDSDVDIAVLDRAENPLQDHLSDFERFLSDTARWLSSKPS